jgi:hypothetical protein
VTNEFTSTVTAYVVWPNNRLGEVGSHRTRTFQTPLAGDESPSDSSCWPLRLLARARGRAGFGEEARTA